MKTDEPILTVPQLSEYWKTISSVELPPPVRPFTIEDERLMDRYYDHDFDADGKPILLMPGVTGKKYLDLIQRLRIETGHPSNRELFDFSHLMSAHFIEHARSLQK